jgi:CHASE2 domain-containing sensor protein
MRIRWISAGLCTLIFLLSALSRCLAEDITIITINKQTVERIGPYPFPRDRYADFIESIYSNYSPGCVYFNLLISQYREGTPESDSRLFDAVYGKPNLFFSAMTADAEAEHGPYEGSRFDGISSKRVWEAGGAVFPLKEITRGGAYASISDVRSNKRGFVEMMPTVILINGHVYLSTPLFLTAAYLKVDPNTLITKEGLALGNNTVKTDQSGWFEIDFDHTFNKYSYQQVLNKEVKKDQINGRIVLVGIDFPELEGYLKTGRNRSMAGVEVIANAVQTLIDRLR